MRLKKFAIVLGLILILFPYSIKAEDTILLGCSAALSGHAGFLGQNLVMGMKAYFNYINDQGGINGKKIKATLLSESAIWYCAYPMIATTIAVEKIYFR